MSSEMKAKTVAAAKHQAAESDFSARKIKIATVCLFGQTFATNILPFMALSYVLIPMTKEFGWSRTEFNLAQSCLMWSGSLFIWGFGRLSDRIGVRPVIILGTIMVGIDTLVVAHIQTLWQFYVCFGLLGVFGCTGAAYSKVIASLFTQNRGKAMAIFGAEGTAVRFFIPMLTAALILHYSWRGLFTVYGAVILAVTGLVYVGLVEPGAHKVSFGLFSRGKAGTPVRAAPPPMVFEGMQIREVMRDGVFWLMLTTTLVSGVISSGMMANTIAAIQDKGFSAQTAARFMSIATLVGLGGTFLGGFLIDRFHTTKVAAPFHLISALGAFLLMVVTPSVGGHGMLLAAICCGGFAAAAALPMGAYFQTRFFGLRSFAEVTGFTAAIQGVVMGFSAPLIGFIYDQTHSYAIGFMLQIVTALFAAFVFLILPGYRYSANIGAMPAPPKPEGDAAAFSPDRRATA
jgi:MFS family permease